jgi:hypothetical protein
MSRTNYHVTHRADSSWAVMGEGSQRASSLHTTQSAAIQAARPLAQRAKGELRLHGTDNRIREGWSYGNDPCPPKG